MNQLDKLLRELKRSNIDYTHEEITKLRLDYGNVVLTFFFDESGSPIHMEVDDK